MPRRIKSEPIYKWMREPRKGELNYELKRILTENCTQKSFKDAVKGIELAVARLASKYGFNEYECKYDRDTSLRSSRPWVTESVQVVIFRKRPNGTTAIHRVGASKYPRFFKKDGKGYANLSAARDITIFYGVDDPYDWENRTCKKPRKALQKKWAKVRKTSKK